MIGLLTGLVACAPAARWLSPIFSHIAPRGGWPIQNGGELAALFCFVFLFIAARGAGIWSVDAVLVRRRQSVPVAGTEGWSRA